mmetsp:Transcript_95180/g.188566  ORF Transcript_95180/g.188566 Transcript_95180/m.188566 type:complete len:274 (-) Transcript_95180:3-824(-)
MHVFPLLHLWMAINLSAQSCDLRECTRNVVLWNAVDDTRTEPTDQSPYCKVGYCDRIPHNMTVRSILSDYPLKPTKLHCEAPLRSDEFLPGFHFFLCRKAEGFADCHGNICATINGLVHFCCIPIILRMESCKLTAVTCHRLGLRQHLAVNFHHWRSSKWQFPLSLQSISFLVAHIIKFHASQEQRHSNTFSTPERHVTIIDPDLFGRVSARRGALCTARCSTQRKKCCSSTCSSKEPTASTKRTLQEYWWRQLPCNIHWHASPCNMARLPGL